MASADILVVTFAANAVVLGSLLQDKGYKKLKYKHPVIGVRPTERTAGKSVLQKQWGSDEDLMRADDFETNSEAVELSEIPSHRIPPTATLRSIVVKSTWEVNVAEAKVAR